MTTGPSRDGMSAAVSFRLDSLAWERLTTSEGGLVGRHLAKVSQRIERRAKRYAPVDTGRLRSSIAWRLERDSRGLVGVVGSNVHYAIHQELGTRGRPGVRFLTRALDEERHGGLT